MNPIIKKQFITDIWQYNNSLETPFFIYYESPVIGSYHYSNFLKIQTDKENKIDYSTKEKEFLAFIEKELEKENKHPNIRPLSLVGDEFLVPYFRHFFNTHPELQVNLLKFFNNLLSYNHKPLDFLKTLKKEEVEPLILNFKQWFSYSTQNLDGIQDLMNHINSNNAFKVSFFKNYVKHNLKIINKNPTLSSQLEVFIQDNYPDYFKNITTNVTSIEIRQQEIKSENYLNAFSKEKIYSIIETIDMDKVLKTFQIAGWTYAVYIQVISLYNSFICERENMKINCAVSQNNKSLEITIKMKDDNFSIDTYKNELLVLLKFFRENPKLPPKVDMISQILLNNTLHESLEKRTIGIKPKKI